MHPVAHRGHGSTARTSPRGAAPGSLGHARLRGALALTPAPVVQVRRNCAQAPGVRSQPADGDHRRAARPPPFAQLEAERMDLPLPQVRVLRPQVPDLVRHCLRPLPSPRSGEAAARSAAAPPNSSAGRPAGTGRASESKPHRVPLRWAKPRQRAGDGRPDFSTRTRSPTSSLHHSGHSHSPTGGTSPHRCRRMFPSKTADKSGTYQGRTRSNPPRVHTTTVAPQGPRPDAASTEASASPRSSPRALARESWMCRSCAR